MFLFADFNAWVGYEPATFFNDSFNSHIICSLFHFSLPNPNASYADFGFTRLHHKEWMFLKV